MCSMHKSVNNGPIGLWAAILKPQVCILAITILFFLVPELTIFGRKCPVGHALKHTLLYCLFDSKWDHNLQNKHHAVLEKT